MTNVTSYSAGMRPRKIAYVDIGQMARGFLLLLPGFDLIQIGYTPQLLPPPGACWSIPLPTSHWCTCWKPAAEE